jgi:solute carrier family 13 (sodium-dependent dicarboxylate transporter), member 2/3/5
MAVTARPARPPRAVNGCLPAGLAVALAALTWSASQSLPFQGRAALVIFALAILGWTLTSIDDTAIALAACLALMATGSIGQAQLLAALGHELLWLMLAALLIAGVLRHTTLAERLALAAVSRVRSVSRLFHVLTLCIAATAFAVPSTSARAIVLLPVFISLSDALRCPRLTCALSLLFPSVILLSACGALTGAGAHLIALDMLEAMPGGERIGYLAWLVLALPVAIVSSHAAAFLILRLFLGSTERARRPSIDVSHRAGMPSGEWRVVAIVAATIALWATSDLHGLGLATVGLTSALMLVLPGISVVSPAKAIRSVDWRMLLFLAATMLLGDALLSSGAAAWITGAMLTASLPRLGANPAGVALLLAAAALLSHLVILSRSARAAVLIPMLALPVAGLGFSPAAVVLLVVIGTGFCQTLRASAKAVTIYGGLDRAVFTADDLLRLSAALFPVLICLLLLFALAIWPALGLSFAGAGIGSPV